MVCALIGIIRTEMGGAVYDPILLHVLLINITEVLVHGVCLLYYYFDFGK